MPGFLEVDRINHDIDLSRYSNFVNPQFISRVTPGLDGSAGALHINESGPLLTYAKRDFSTFQNSLWGIKFLLVNNLVAQASNQSVRTVSCRNALGQLVLRVNLRKLVGGGWEARIIFRDDNLAEQTHVAPLNAPPNSPELFDLQFLSGAFQVSSPGLSASFLGTYGTASGLADFRVGYLDIVPPPIDGSITIDEIIFYTNDESRLPQAVATISPNMRMIYDMVNS